MLYGFSNGGWRANQINVIRNDEFEAGRVD
jgi:hypothetical protein